ncbi:MAG: 6,7-dimethyl-8-ribityllumazine synthase [Candidatus Omnitrophica bacterium]|nr:6,7-dimethyl-8-ribityllumazine synthase [Candidatus Omnitrophota bacterium]
MPRQPWAETRVVIVAARFHAALTQALVRGARRTLRRAGILPQHLDIIWVPGAFELPVVASHVAHSHRAPDAIVAVGVLIRGETVQHEVIAHAVAQGLGAVSVATGLPVTFGVIVADTLEQAKARAGGRVGNRGAEAAMAALAVLNVFKKCNV